MELGPEPQPKASLKDAFHFGYPLDAGSLEECGNEWLRGPGRPSLARGPPKDPGRKLHCSLAVTQSFLAQSALSQLVPRLSEQAQCLPSENCHWYLVHPEHAKPTRCEANRLQPLWGCREWLCDVEDFGNASRFLEEADRTVGIPDCIRRSDLAALLPASKLRLARS